MNSDDLVRIFGSAIGRFAGSKRDAVERDALLCISAICAATNAGEYDWTNSPEGFSAWVERVFVDRTAIQREMRKHYDRIKKADERFEQVHDAIKAVCEPGVAPAKADDATNTED